MWMQVRARALAVSAALFCLAPAASAVTIAWTPIGNPGNAADTTSYGAVGDAYNIGTYEVTNSQYAEFLTAKAAADPLGLYNTSMGSGFGGITRSGVSGSFTYSAISGRTDMPVNYVSFYDTLRFANWLNNGQGAGSTEYRGLHAAGRDGDAEQRHDGDAQRRRDDLPHERRRVVQGGLRERARDELLRLSGGLGHADDVCGADRDGQSGQLQQRCGQPDDQGQLHGLGEPLRHVRPGRERLGVERGDHQRLESRVPWAPRRGVQRQRELPRRVVPVQPRPGVRAQRHRVSRREYPRARYGQSPDPRDAQPGELASALQIAD
jgi:hypothetical protein